jgi:hypothetical protein
MKLLYLQNKLNFRQEYCTMLQVILTPTCRVSRYPRQVTEVDAAWTTTLYLDSVTNSYNTYNNYTTRHLYHFELVYLPFETMRPH